MKMEHAHKIIQELLEEELPFLLRSGLTLLDKGIQRYYYNIEKENKMFSQSLSLKQSFVIVLLIHVGAIAGIMWTSSTKTAHAKEEDKKYVGIESPALPTAAPMDQKPESWPKGNPVITKPKPKYTTEYIVKKGDTITSISKKYKLNPDRLRILNKIKEDKIYVGQTLKLL